MKLTKSKLQEIIKEELSKIRKVNELKVGDKVLSKRDNRNGKVTHIHHNQQRIEVELDTGLTKNYSFSDIDVINEDLLTEEEYDYYRDLYGPDPRKWPASARRSEPSYSRRRTSRSRAPKGTPIYLDIPFREKDDLKKKHGKALRWDPDKKSWYYLLQRGESLPKDLERRKK